MGRFIYMQYFYIFLGILNYNTCPKQFFYSSDRYKIWDNWLNPNYSVTYLRMSCPGIGLLSGGLCLFPIFPKMRKTAVLQHGSMLARCSLEQQVLDLNWTLKNYVLLERIQKKVILLLCTSILVEKSKAWHWW